MTETFDIDSVKELESSVLKLVHPETGVQIPATITLAGPNHPKRKQIEFNRSRALRARVSKKGRFELTDPEEDVEYEIDRLVVCTLSWSGFTKNGQPIECNAGEARAMYAKGWVRDQALAFMGDSANFLQSTASV